MTDSSELELNRTVWTSVNAQFTDADAERAWQAEEIVWGRQDTVRRHF